MFVTGWLWITLHVLREARLGRADSFSNGQMHVDFYETQTVHRFRNAVDPMKRTQYLKLHLHFRRLYVSS